MILPIIYIMKCNNFKCPTHPAKLAKLITSSKTKNKKTFKKGNKEIK